MLEEDPENEEIVARVAACDIGKAELVCCARLPHEDRPGRRLQEVTTWSTMGCVPWSGGTPGLIE
jgi:transposase